MEEQLYRYRAKIVSVYDGDTVRADIDLGLKTWIRNEKLRLARINSPELRGPDRDGGLAARDFLQTLVGGQEIILETVRDRKGKYGRYLAELWKKNETSQLVNINDLLVENGHAKLV